MPLRWWDYRNYDAGLKLKWNIKNVNCLILSLLSPIKLRLGNKTLLLQQINRQFENEHKVLHISVVKMFILI